MSSSVCLEKLIYTREKTESGQNEFLFECQRKDLHLVIISVLDADEREENSGKQGAVHSLGTEMAQVLPCPRD